MTGSFYPSTLTVLLSLAINTVWTPTALAGDQDSVLVDSTPERPALQSTTPDSVSSTIHVEIERQFNNLRTDLLDQRADSIDSWLTVLALVFTFFGIIVAIAGFFGFSRFREIEAEARKSVDAAASFATKAGRITEDIIQNKEQSEDILRHLDARIAVENPEDMSQAIDLVHSNPDSTLLDNAVADALSLYSEGKIVESLRKWHAIAELAAEHDTDLAARAWLSVGFLVASKDLKYSITANDRAIRLNPTLGGAYVNRGAAKHALHQYDDAISDYNEAIRLDPSYANSYSNRGVSLAALGDYRAAIADHDRAIHLKPDQASFYANRGVAKDEIGEHEAAIDDHSRALRLDPKNAEYYSNRGVAKAGGRRYEEAIADHNKAIELEPSRAVLYDNRGNAQYAAGQHEVALIDYDKAIELQPTFAKAYNNRGNAYEAMSQHDDAIRDYDEALHHQVDFPEAYNNRGETRAELGQFESAIADYDEALRINPKLTEAFLNRGKANATLGRKVKARRDFEAAIRLGRTARTPNVAEEAKELLRNLGA